MIVKNKSFVVGALTGVVLILGLLVVGINPVQSDDHMERDSQQTIVEVASNNDGVSTLVKAIKSAGLVETLNSEGPFTVFAPSNQAFSQLPDEKLNQLLEPENQDQLKNLLTYHVIPGRVTSRGVMGIDGVHQSGGSMVETVQGNKININVVGETIKINGNTVVKPNIEASNGVIHVINGVLNPSSSSPSGPMDMMGSTIEKGAPMYNAGHHGETAELYMETSNRILDMYSDEMPSEAIEALEHSTGLARLMKDDSERAWVLRYGMDAAMRTIEHDGNRNM